MDIRLGNSPVVKRRLRSPRHNWNLYHRPWQVQPFMIAPVLPGETLKNLTMQARVVTDPIVNPIIGWWCEHYVFYVKLRDLYSRDLLTAMVLKPETDLSSLDGATDRAYYHVNGADLAINWPKLCVESIVDNYFRHEGEVSTDYTLNGLPTAQIGMDCALDSACNASVFEAGAAGVDQNLVSAVAGQGDATTAVFTSEIDKAMREYEYARLMKTTDMTFEDWCESFGVSFPKEELFKPELIRYSKDWSYPSNTIDPTNGTPRSAVSWSVTTRADKDRVFREPGFLVGVTVVRPKVYLKNLTSHFTMLMKNAYAWLPPQLAADPMASWQKVTAADPPLDLNTGAYYVDVKDLFIYGDQFINYDTASLPTGLGSKAPNSVALPNVGLTNRRYPATTDADALFVDNTAGKSGVLQDGVCELHILGRQVETSPMAVGTNKTV